MRAQRSFIGQPDSVRRHPAQPVVGAAEDRTPAGAACPRRKRWPYIVSLSVLVFVLMLFIAQAQEVLRVTSPLAAGDPQFVDYVASLLGAPVSDGDRYVALRNGVEIFPAMLEAIRGA